MNLYTQWKKLNGVYMPFFINDLTKIELNCKFTASVRHTNLAHSLNGYLWAVSSLATEKLQICCLHHTSVITIEPPLRIVDIGNGCEAFSPTLYMSCISKTACFPVNYAPHSLQPGRNEEP